MNYHFTKSENLGFILTNGLKPENGENSKAVNDLRSGQPKKLSFAIGMENEILINLSFYIRYAIAKESDYAKFITETDRLLCFDSNIVENENVGDGVDAHTTNPNGIPSNKLKIACLKSKDGRKIYNKNEIVLYMMSKIPLELFRDNPEFDWIHKVKPLEYLYNPSYPDRLPTNITDEEKRKRMYLANRNNYSYLEEFYKINKKDIHKYKDSNLEWELDYEDFREFCERHNIHELTEELQK